MHGNVHVPFLTNLIQTSIIHHLQKVSCMNSAEPSSHQKQLLSETDISVWSSYLWRILQIKQSRSEFSRWGWRWCLLNKNEKGPTEELFQWVWSRGFFHVYKQLYTLNSTKILVFGAIWLNFIILFGCFRWNIKKIKLFGIEFSKFQAVNDHGQVDMSANVAGSNPQGPAKIYQW